MADKKPKGKKKKVLVVAGVLLLVVALVVVLVFVIPGGKTSQKNLDEVSAISMADNEDSKADYQQLATKIETTAGVQYYLKEVKGFITLTNAVDIVIDYYNEYYPLAQNIGGYATNIDSYLNDIKVLQRQINFTQQQITTQTTSGYTHLQNVWIDFRSVYADQLNEYKELFAILNQMYHNCLGNSFAVNEGSKLVLNAVDDYMYIICKDINKIVQTDVKGSKEADYNLGQFIAKIDAFEDFVVNHLTSDRTFITKFYSNTGTEYSQLNKFFTKLNEVDLKNIIDAICYSSGNLKSTYVSDNILSTDTESEQVQTLAKNFVLGGL